MRYDKGGDVLKRLGCRDLGGDCDFVATGETPEQVKKALFDHAAKEHKEILEKMTLQDKIKITAKMDSMLNKQ